MTHEYDIHEPERYEFDEPPRYTFSLTRRAFVQVVGAGLLITSFAPVSFAQRGRSGGSRTLGGRFHIDKDGIVTAYTSKVEVGQGSRTELTQAAAEELHVPLHQVRLVMADTEVVPNDGGTYGSLTTPRTVPTMRRAAASARQVLIELACDSWGVDPKRASVRDGIITHPDGHRMTLAELASSTQIAERLEGQEPDEAALTPTDGWRVMGQSISKVGGREVVTGKHRYPSDIRLPGMLYGKVLRPPSYEAELVDVDEKAARDIEGVTVVRDGDFVGCVAPNAFLAQKAIDALAATAKWNEKPHPSSDDLYRVLKENVSVGSGRYRSRDNEEGDVDAALSSAKTVLRREYHIPYIQHAPMEPRAALATWDGGNLTVWTGTQRPFGVQGELARAFSMSTDNVHVVVPDTGGGFGGKHTGEVAIEAARLAQEVGRPVARHWTREEEFTWAYFRPAGVIETAAAIDANGAVTAWEFVNYNSGASGLDSPYNFPNVREQFKYSDSPLREGSYRALASTANNFAREAFIDEIATATGADPLAFRLAHLREERLANTLKAAANRFQWQRRMEEPGSPNVGIGLACGTEKGSYVATCVEVELQGRRKRIHVRQICTAFECGAVVNPRNLRAQIEGSIVMGLGGALSEAITFENGKITNGSFEQYQVPRFEDVPLIDIVLVERPDLASVGAGETPIIGIAPAIANAVARTTGSPVHQLPISVA